MRLIQYRRTELDRALGLVDGNRILPLPDYGSLRELALAAIDRGLAIGAIVAAAECGRPEDYDAIVAEGRMLPPLDHPDPAHCLVSGTGLTHVGSATARDDLNRKMEGGGAVTDTMRLFKLGLDGGKPRGEPGVQPEWFYKGDGGNVAAPGQPLRDPSFSDDCGEEPEVVALYVIGGDRRPYRIGFAIGNEASDHVMEKQNYLYLAHSKMRMCSFGPEAMIGALPEEVEGRASISRDGQTIWAKPFRTGEANMCHSLANIEYHQFKYNQFLRPGDVQVVFLGTSVASFADGVRTAAGDQFVVDIPVLGRPLVNGIQRTDPEIGFAGVVAL